MAVNKELSSRGKWIPLVLVIAGLLCIALTSLLTGLHLLLETRNRHQVIEERDRLLQDLQDMVLETKNYQQVTEERDRLLQELQNTVLETKSYQQVTEERDGLLHVLKDIDKSMAEGWMYFGGSLYLLNPIQQSWNESREFCQKRGADLIIINSEQEQEYAGLTFQHIWIGLSDLDDEGEWKWVDGSPLTTSFWHSGEPNNNRGTEHCVEIFEIYRPNGLHSWNDLPCSKRLRCVCEK